MDEWQDEISSRWWQERAEAAAKREAERKIRLRGQERLLQACLEGKFLVVNEVRSTK